MFVLERILPAGICHWLRRPTRAEQLEAATQKLYELRFEIEDAVGQLRRETRGLRIQATQPFLSRQFLIPQAATYTEGRTGNGLSRSWEIFREEYRLDFRLIDRWNGNQCLWLSLAPTSPADRELTFEMLSDVVHFVNDAVSWSDLFRSEELGDEPLLVIQQGQVRSCFEGRVLFSEIRLQGSVVQAAC